VNGKEGIAFSLPGAAGAIIGSYIGHLVGGGLLLFTFGFVMIGVAMAMLRTENIGSAGGVIPVHRLIRVIPAGLTVGILSGVFGIGGRFLIVPALVYSAGLTMVNAVGTSLIVVGTFGVTSAATYAVFGEVSPVIAILFLLGGVAGGYVGTRVASGLSNLMLKKVFAVVVIVVAIYIIYQNYYAIAPLL
jgi:Sulfite exporter TauE/SafE.